MAISNTVAHQPAAADPSAQQQSLDQQIQHARLQQANLEAALAAQHPQAAQIPARMLVLTPRARATSLFARAAKRRGRKSSASARKMPKGGKKKKAGKSSSAGGGLFGGKGKAALSLLMPNMKSFSGFGQGSRQNLAGLMQQLGVEKPAEPPRTLTAALAPLDPAPQAAGMRPDSPARVYEAMADMTASGVRGVDGSGAGGRQQVQLLDVQLERLTHMSQVISFLGEMEAQLAQGFNQSLRR